MEIHILREGTELGPFTEEVVQSLLQQGSVSITDLSWRAGLEQWVPLANLLYATAPTANSAATPPAPPAPSDSEAEPKVDTAPSASPASPAPTPASSSEPASARQKAFLSYLGISFAPELTKLAAAELVNDAMENPRDSARLAKWNDERLKLYPELFATELQALKEGRAQRFFEICQEQGAEYFSKVTKAHAQVLVGFLDVSYPRWDADERTAAWNYFFPAIAEKFPQLVNKEARGKFKFPAGPKVAHELARKAPAPQLKVKKARPSPLWAMLRGVFFGGLILAVMWYVKNLRDAHRADGPASATASAKLGTPVNAAPAAPTDPSAALAPAAPPARNPSSSPSSPNPSSPEKAASSNPDNPPNPDEPVAGGAATPLPSGTTPSADAPSLFGPDPTPTPASSAALPAHATLTLTRPVEVLTPYGRVKIQPGTVVKVVQQTGSNVQVIYLNNTVTVPITSTNLGTGSEAPHPAASVAPSTPAPATPAAAAGARPPQPASTPEIGRPEL